MENNAEEKELSEPIEIESISNVVYDLDMGSFDDRLMEAYIQNPQMLRRVQKGAKINWCAVLFAHYYYIYRKQYKYGVLFYLISMLIYLAVIYFNLSLMMYYGACVLLWLVEGLAFYPLYIKQMQRQLDQIKQLENLDDSSKLFVAKRMGGTSLWILLMFLLLTGIALV